MKIVIALSLLLLAACASLPDGSKMPSGTVLCSDGVWGRVMGANINADVAGTKGGKAGVKCAAGEITFTDSGDLASSGQSIRVPVEATPMKLSPKAP